MSDKEPKKKGKRMMDTNVRVTKDTHSRLKTLSDTLGLTMSEAIDFIIIEHYPDIEEERKALEERKRKVASLKKRSGNSDN